MQVYLRDGSAQTAVRAATLTQKLDITCPISSSHGILTPDQQSQRWPYNIIRLGAWQAGHLSYQFESHWYDSTWKESHGENGNRIQACHSRGGRLCLRSTGRFLSKDRREHHNSVGKVCGKKVTDLCDPDCGNDPFLTGSVLVFFQRKGVSGGGTRVGVGGGGGGGVERR